MHWSVKLEEILHLLHVNTKPSVQRILHMTAMESLELNIKIHTLKLNHKILVSFFDCFIFLGLARIIELLYVIGRSIQNMWPLWEKMNQTKGLIMLAVWFHVLLQNVCSGCHWWFDWQPHKCIVWLQFIHLEGHCSLSSFQGIVNHRD